MAPLAGQDPWEGSGHGVGACLPCGMDQVVSRQVWRLESMA